MVINDNKLRKYIKDADLIKEIERKIRCYIYFLDYVGQYTPYINGSGMDYDTRYTYEVKKVIRYNDEEIYCTYETETYREEEGFTPDKFSRGSLICSYSTDLTNPVLNELYTKEKLDEAITKDYNITDEIINNFYNNGENIIESKKEENNTDDELYKLYKEIDAINVKIDDKKSTIEALKKAIEFLEEEKTKINQEIEQKENAKRK